jgi:hypothetical protein
MIKRFGTIFCLLVLSSNLLSAWPPHPAGTGGCEAECCATAHQTGPAATSAGLCCMVECPPVAELPAQTVALAPTPALKQGLGLNAGAVTAPIVIAYLQHTRFPSAPTRSLHGSASRYLETGALLI